MFPPGPSLPLTYVVSIYHISIQYKGFAGSRGGHTFILKMIMTLFLYCLTGFALKHVSLMHMCNKTRTKACLFQQYILCLVLLQIIAAKTTGNHVFICSLNISGVRKCKY